jgi:hypothetical protein
MLTEMTRPVAATAISKRFGRFKDEDEKSVRAPNVVRNDVLEQLTDAWKRFGMELERKRLESRRDLAFDTRYNAALSAVRYISYPAQDVERFSIACIQFQDENHFCSNAGIFLSALINNCKDNDFVINTGHLTEKIWCLGYQNTKNITVFGDIDRSLGREMKCGTITVEGNAGGWVGYLMEGGSIIVKGSAKVYVGNEMKNGKITVGGDVGISLGADMEGGTIKVKGNAGDHVGAYMKGGELNIHGMLGSLDEPIRDGKIYHRGVQIYPKKGGC